MNRSYFDIKIDKQFPCFCEACLIGKTEEQMSQKDMRYCLDCQPIIEDEYYFQASGKRIRYKPIPATKSKIKGVLSGDIQMPITKQKEVLLPTKNATDQIYQNLTKNRPIPNVGGRPRKDIPTMLIKELSGKDMGIKQIVKELKAQGHKISAMTVSRVLSGERKMCDEDSVSERTTLQGEKDCLSNQKPDCPGLTHPSPCP